MLALAGGVLLGHGGWIQAKAALAQVLMQHAWTRSLRDGAGHRPWPWADFWPVARLEVPAHDIDLIVLEGDAGNALAFGPGHNPRSGSPASDDTVVISGHRDTHFRFLQQIRPGERVMIQTAQGVRTYRVDHTAVVDARVSRLSVTRGDRRLLLVTCFPFGTLATGGPMRYLVTATRSS